MKKKKYTKPNPTGVQLHHSRISLQQSEGKMQELGMMKGIAMAEDLNLLFKEGDRHSFSRTRFKSWVSNRGGGVVRSGF